MNLRCVGIDFSLNSPAFCCFKNNRYIWGSVSRSDRTFESLLKNKKKPYFILDSDDSFVIKVLKKQEFTTEYSAREREKMDYFLEVVEVLWSSILEVMGDEPFHVAMEGLSFSSNGNSLVDISMATALLRERIMDRIGSENFYVFSPTTLKKFAVKGNAKKDELYHSLYNLREDETNLNVFCKILEENKTEWITPAKAINKPIDDVVDSTWVNLYLKEELRGNNEVIKGKSKSKKTTKKLG
jgi:hypothetical protein